MPIYHGIKVNEINTGARAITPVALSVIGLVATATAASGGATTALNTAFPLDTPVLVTDVRDAIGKAGTGGTLKAALEAIADQCSPTIVVVRIAPGTDAAATSTAAVGTVNGQGQRTGMQAFLDAESLLGVRPRILGAPGLDTQAVATGLVTVAQKLRAFAYAATVGATIAAAVTYKANFDARELMLIHNDGTDFPGSAIARAMGLRARIDTETGWHKSLSNVPVNGLTGLSKALTFDILVGDTTDVSTLNDAGITALVRPAGFRFWGNRTCASEPLFQFETATRTAQALQDEIAQGLIWAIDKPITAQLVKDILETINARFRSLVREGRLIGARAWFDPSANSAADLAGGKLAIDFEYTPCAPAEAITINQRITDRFYASLAEQLLAA